MNWDTVVDFVMVAFLGAAVGVGELVHVTGMLHSAR